MDNSHGGRAFSSLMFAWWLVPNGRASLVELVVWWLNVKGNIAEWCWAFRSLIINCWNGSIQERDEDDDEDDDCSNDIKFDEFRRIKSWNGFCSWSKIFSSESSSSKSLRAVGGDLSNVLEPLDRRPVPFMLAGHVEIISLLLFFVGNEKSLRGQQLTSMSIESSFQVRRRR